jgi:hypothetical protein
VYTGSRSADRYGHVVVTSVVEVEADQMGNEYNQECQDAGNQYLLPVSGDGVAQTLESLCRLSLGLLKSRLWLLQGFLGLYVRVGLLICQKMLLLLRTMLSIMLAVKAADPRRTVARVMPRRFSWLHRATWRAHVG